MKRSLLALVSLLILVRVSAFGQTVPTNMTFQGRLAKPDGTPVSDTTTQQLTFRLYNAASGGAAVWQQTLSNVAVHNGTFSVVLDFTTGFTGTNTLSSVFNIPPYLEIQAGSDPPLAPRQVFRSVAYAFNARTALTVPDGSITTGKLASGVLNFANLSGTVTSAQIANGTITAADLATPFGPVVGKFSGADWLVSSTPTANGALGITVTTIGGAPYAFVTNYYANSFQIINASTPFTPSIISTTPTDANPRAVVTATLGGTLYAFVANFAGNTVGIYNVSNLTAPTLLKTLTTGAAPANLAIGTNGSSTYLYVVNNTSNTLQIFNVTTPASATAAGSVATGSLPYSVALNGTTAYVACYGSNTVQIINAANANAPVVTNTITGVPGAASVSVNGADLAVACYSENTVRFFNVAAAPVLTGVVTTGTNPILITQHGALYYVSCFGSGEVDILDFSGPLRVAGIFPNQTQTNALAYSNGLLYVTLIGSALNIINPGNLTSSFAGGLALADGLNVSDTLIADAFGRNRGTLNYGIRFGTTTSGEGIGSNRLDGTVGQNENGLDFYSNYLRRMSITNAGRVGIGTANPAYPLDVVGDINAQGNVRANGVALSSDARYKTNVVTLHNALDDVLNLRGVTYDFDREKWPARNFPEGRQIGFLAQELERIFPELVSTDAQGYKSVNYVGVVPVLVESVKTLKAQLDDKQRQIDELKRQNAHITDLEKQLAELAAALRQLQAAPNK